jgi:hypothetical protein
MIEALFLLFPFFKSGFRNRTEMAFENLALRQLLAFLKRERPHARLGFSFFNLAKMARIAHRGQA